jgi:DNA-binding helix-hairpin-helix protein with protein kinase domain
VLPSFFIIRPKLAGKSALSATYRRRVRRANEKLVALKQEWDRRADHRVFRSKVEAYEQLCVSLLDNAGRYEEARNKRIRELHQPELASFLRKYSIYAADAGPTGRGKLSQLHDRGITTAADINSGTVSNVQGFDALFWDSVIAWRKALEEQFWGASSFGLPPHEERLILERVYRQDVAIRRELLAAPEELAKIWEQVRAEQGVLSLEAEPYRQIIYRDGPILRSLETARGQRPGR